MSYCQLDADGNFLRQVYGDVQEWDANNYCSVDALVKDGKADQFRVVPLTPTDPPAINPLTQRVYRDGCEKVGGAWQYKWAVEALSAPAIAVNLAAARGALLLKIDADTDAIYRAVQGDRAMEYVLAESDAKAYKAAGYTGTVPDSVASWASAKGQTATWAADDILTTATGWRQAQSSIRATRLACKEQARVASDMTPITAQWSGFVVAIKTALGVA